VQSTLLLLCFEGRAAMADPIQPEQYGPRISA
jgi:hypothetical protein